ncbi:hypothetical protein QAD02_005910 [Eretmocerus hayati]|uniref:Uncharacterized protein n=1 Tax=Eretmocerus hayati TaxID=131215 RepID=A0ACC2N0I2_9HYME|nr:hypothetical protein QAD02_005910 [Eretmocerus hayati]
MFKFAVFVLQVLLLSALYTQETRSWRMAEYVREMNTPWKQWGPVHHNDPKMEEPVEIRSEEHCKKSPVKMEEYPFFVRVQVWCYDDSEKTIWAGERQHYCVLYTSTDIRCRYSERLPGHFCDATAEFVADGSIHEIKLFLSKRDGYKYYKLSKPIDDSSKAKPMELSDMKGDFTISAVIMTVMPTVGEKYGLVYTENISYTKSDSCTGWGDVSPSDCDPTYYWCKFRSEEHCKKSSVKMEEYPFFVRVQIKCYDDSRKTIWAGERQHYCVLFKADLITCRYSEPLPGYFCDATAELVADGSIHEIKWFFSNKYEYKYYELNEPIEDSSKAKPTGRNELEGNYALPAILMTFMPTVGEQYGLIYSENITYTQSDTWTGFDDTVYRYWWYKANWPR